jgi:hypothetical protein
MTSEISTEGTATTTTTSSDYLHRIKNETDRVKRRARRQRFSSSKGLTATNSIDGGASVDSDDNDSTAAADRDYIEQPQKPKRTITPHLQQQSQQQQQQQQQVAAAAGQDPEASLNNDSCHREDDLSYPIDLDQRGESVSFENDKSFVDPVPQSNMSKTLQAEHEAFKLRLIGDVLGDDATDKVPMEKVVMLIWQFRDDPQVVRFMTRFVAKVRFFF